MYQNTRKNKRKIPRTLVGYFFVLNYVFDVDFGFNKMLKKILRPFANFISFVRSLFTIGVYIILAVSDTHESYVGVLCLLQYISTYLILKSTKHTFYDFLIDIHNITDGRLKSIQNELIGVYMCLFTFILYVSKVSLNMAYCYYIQHYSFCSLSPYHYSIFIFANICMDLVASAQILIYYYIYCYVGSLKKFVNKSNVIVKVAQKRYAAVADCFERIKPFYNRMMLVELIFVVPKLLANLYLVLFFIQRKFGTIPCVTGCVFAAYEIIRVTIPAIFAELVNSQMEQLKLALHEKMFHTEDETKNIEVVRLLRYMEGRRLRHKAWRFIPVDIRLPLALFSITGSYLIVILQFTHLYD